MRIVHICISEKYVEGMSYQENLLSQAHKRFGHDVYIITIPSYKDKNRTLITRRVHNYYNDFKIEVRILPFNYQNKLLRYLLPSTAHLYDNLESINPDIIFVHGVTASDNKTIVSYVKKHSNVKLYVDNHNDYYNTPIKKDLKNILLRRIAVKHAKMLIHNTECFWGTTPWRVEYLHDVYKIPQKKVDLLIMGGDERQIVGKDIKTIRDNIRQHLNIPQETFLICTGGTIDKRKKQDLLMDAVCQLSTKKIRLLVFGKPTKEMEPIISKYKDSENIVFTGWIPSSDSYDLFLASDLAFFPGTHSVLWEQAVACGIPLVVQHWHGMEHVNYNGNAILVDNVNVDTIKHCIKDLVFTKLYFDLKEKAHIAAPHFFLSNLAKRAIGI